MYANIQESLRKIERTCTSIINKFYLIIVRKCGPLPVAWVHVTFWAIQICQMNTNVYMTCTTRLASLFYYIIWQCGSFGCNILRKLEFSTLRIQLYHRDHKQYCYSAIRHAR